LPIKFILHANKPLLSNSNAMPKPDVPVKVVDDNKKKKRQGIAENQIKTSNSSFYPTDSSASPLPPLYSGETQRNYSS